MPRVHTTITAVAEAVAPAAFALSAVKLWRWRSEKHRKAEYGAFKLSKFNNSTFSKFLEHAFSKFSIFEILIFPKILFVET